MDAYMYQAALICACCAERERERLMRSPSVKDIDLEDSDVIPQGPYGNGGGEADSPQHCDICGVFLENPLTDDGLEYVKAARESNVSKVWREFYRLGCAA